MKEKKIRTKVGIYLASRCLFQQAQKDESFLQSFSQMVKALNNKKPVKPKG